MAKNNKDTTQQKLDTIIDLLRHILAVELYKSNVTKEAIREHLHIAKATVVRMLKGIDKEK